MMFPDDSHRREFFVLTMRSCFTRYGFTKGLSLLYDTLHRVRTEDLRSLTIGPVLQFDSDTNEMVIIDEPAIFLRIHDRELVDKANMEISLFGRRNLPEELRHLIGTFVSEHIGTLYTPTQMIQYAQYLLAETKRTNPTHHEHTHACQHRSEFAKASKQA